jgi:hypothetical protein
MLKKLFMLSVVILSAACSGKLYFLPPRFNVPPPGITTTAWNLCFDHITGVLNQAQHTVPYDIPRREWECAKTYLLEACGKWMHQNHRFSTTFTPGGEEFTDFSQFLEHMRGYGEACEEEGFYTDFIKSMVHGFYDRLDAEALACPVACPVPK